MFICLFVCLFVCFPVKNQWILAPMDLTFMFSAPGFGWDPKADRADLPHIVEVLVPPQRSTDVPSPRWLGAPKINSSPLKIGNPKKGKAKLSPKHQFSVPSFGGGGYGLFLRGRMEDGGWRYVDQNEREQPFFFGILYFLLWIDTWGTWGRSFSKNVSGVNLLESKIPPKTLHCNAWKYQRGREIRNSHEHLFLCRFKCVARISLGGGFKYFLFLPLPREIIQFDSYFSDGLKPPTSSACPWN